MTIWQNTQQNTNNKAINIQRHQQRHVGSAE